MNFVIPKTPLKAVAFDLDGLMVNSEDLYEIAGEKLLAARGFRMNDTLRAQMIGRPVHDSFQLVIDEFGLPETTEELAAEAEVLVRELTDRHLEPMPGLVSLLEKLTTAGIPRAVTTSGTREYAHRLIGQLELHDFFQFVLTSDDITHGKPAPDVYLLAAKQFEVEPAAMMVLEDSGNGCRAGVAAGAYVVAVPNRHTEQHSFPGAALVANLLEDQRIASVLGL